MNQDMLRSLMGQVQDLERRGVRYRQGTVTALSPLSVALGGSSTAYTSVKQLERGPLAVGDVVAVLTFGNDLLVLGPIAVRHVIAGAVSSAGAVVAGQGFSSSRTGLGLYTITFTVAMPTRPAVVLTPVDTVGQAASHASIPNGSPPTTAGFNVIVSDAAATTTADRNFDFIATAT